MRYGENTAAVGNRCRLVQTRVCVCMLNAAVTRPYVVRCARVQVTWTAITIRPERVRLRTGKSFGAVYPVVAGRNVL